MTLVPFVPILPLPLSALPLVLLPTPPPTCSSIPSPLFLYYVSVLPPTSGLSPSVTLPSIYVIPLQLPPAPWHTLSPLQELGLSESQFLSTT